VALAWLLHRKSITAPIVSATSLKQLDDVLNATTLELDPESLAAIDKASAPA
jgi:aryl-alcohol dehydrogenase-like predicted oxidoreductase